MIAVLAHITQVPHQEPVRSASSGGGASTLLIVAVIAVTLVVLAGLVMLKRRVDGRTG